MFEGESLGVFARAHIDDRDRELERRRDDLLGLTAARMEGRAERLVASDDLAE